jgi:hypothetical protein
LFSSCSCFSTFTKNLTKLSLSSSVYSAFLYGRLSAFFAYFSKFEREVLYFFLSQILSIASKTLSHTKNQSTSESNFQINGISSKDFIKSLKSSEVSQNLVKNLTILSVCHFNQSIAFQVVFVLS